MPLAAFLKQVNSFIHIFTLQSTSWNSKWPLRGRADQIGRGLCAKQVQSGVDVLRIRPTNGRGNVQQRRRLPGL